MITGYKWELYNLNEDVTEANDLAAKMPDKLKELEDVFYAEAKKYDVLPLDNSTLARFLTQRPSTTAGRKVFDLLRRVDRRACRLCPEHLGEVLRHRGQVEIPEGGAKV